MVRLGVAAALAVLMAFGAASAGAQGSPRYRLTGGLASGSGTARSAGHSVDGESGGGLAAARSSSTSADVIGGFVGTAFDPRGTFAIETDEAEFASIAFPLRSESDAVGDVLDELGVPDVRAWRLGRWSPGDSTYVQPIDGGLGRIAPGRGYFLITAEPRTIEQSGLTVPVEDFEIELEDGPGGRPAYNQLGNPFRFPIAVADLEATDGATSVPLTAVENTLTEAAVKVYDADTHSYLTNPALIEPGAAFWVRKLAPGPVRVIVPYRAGAESDEAPAATPPGAEWTIGVTARQGRRASERLVLGAAPVAADAWNPMCLSRTPDPPAGALGLSVREGSWGRHSGDYVRLFRPAAAATTWEFDLRGAQWPGEVTLALDSSGLPAAARTWIEAPASGWSREVTGQPSISLAARRVDRLRLRVLLDGAPEPHPRLVDGFRSAYPNPFRGQSGLVFTLSRAATVRASIYDVTGRSVRMLSGTASSPGERVLLWDGRDDAGRPAAPGVYLARYRAGAVEGTARLVKLE